MISSAASRTPGVTLIAPNCHIRWSVRVLALERKFSNEGFSTDSAFRAAIAGIEVVLEEGAEINFVEGIFLFGRGGGIGLGGG